jgi:hypothetical protein
MNSSPINEVPVRINPKAPVAMVGEASQVSSWATARIEHRRAGPKKRLKGCEGTSDSGRPPREHFRAT